MPEETIEDVRRSMADRRARRERLRMPVQAQGTFGSHSRAPEEPEGDREDYLPAPAPMTNAEALAIVEGFSASDAEALFSGVKQPRPTPKRIIQLVGQYAGLSTEELMATTVQRRVVQPRHVAMLLCRILAGMGLSQIARHFAGRDPTTVRHALLKMAWLHRDLVEKLDATAPVEQWVRLALALSRTRENARRPRI